MSAATTRSRTARTPAPDRLCAEAVDLARAAAEEAAAPGVVGEHVALVSEGDRVVTHYFESKEPGYRGWRWAVTVARASRAKNVTLDETVLLPGSDALLAPEWVPWSERLRPGDMGPGDLLPTEAEDPRLEPGWTGEDEPLPNSAVSDVSQELAALADAEDAELTTLPATSRGSIASVADELGTRRARVLSRYGLGLAADRWDEEFGARTPMAQAAPAVLRLLCVPGPDGGLAEAGLRGLRERVRPGGRPGGLPVVRLRGPLRGRGHAEAPEAGCRTRWTRCGWTTTRCVRRTTPARSRPSPTARRKTWATPDVPARPGVRHRAGPRQRRAAGCSRTLRAPPRSRVPPPGEHPRDPGRRRPSCPGRRPGESEAGALPGDGALRGFPVAVPSGAHWASRVTGRAE